MTRAIRIGIDASCWLNRRGFGRYTRELVRAMLEVDQRNEYVLFLDRATASAAQELPSERRATRVVVETSAAAARAASAEGSRAISDLLRMRRAVAAWGRQLDVFYFPADYTYFPVSTPARVVVTKHDMTDRRVPELLFPTWRSRFFWELKIRLAMRRADLVFTVSENSRRDIVDAFGLGPDQVRVVSDAVDSSFTPASAGPERDAVLDRYGFRPSDRLVVYVGGISPHKNLDTLVAAFAQWHAAGGRDDARLVLIGDYVADVFHSSYPSIRRRIDAAGLDSAIRFTGYMPDADLRYFLSAAQTLVLPSFYEGFGLPVVEAMACGAPVIASNAGALPEVVGGAGLLFDPGSVDALAAALERVLGDASLRRELSERGRARAAQFTWSASARTAIAAFEEIAG
jgi:glycosyltransferase involved in cell wall biosynthesis